MREPPGPCGAGRLRVAVWPRWCSGRRVACLGGPGRCVCRWAAARPRDRHTRACGSEWSISRPALALPPPTGTAAWPRGGLLSVGAYRCERSGPAAALKHRPGPASLRRPRGGLPSVGARCPCVARPCPPVPPAPSTPAVPGMLMSVAPRRCPRVPQPGPSLVACLWLCTTGSALV